MFRSRVWLLWLVLASLWPSLVNARWQFHEGTDAMTDRVIRSAGATTSTGDRVSVFRGNDQQVVLVVTLTRDYLRSGAELSYRVDRLPAQRGLLTMRLGPQMAAVRLWHGDLAKGMGAGLAQLLYGERLLLRVSTISGLVDMEVSLAGAAPAITEAIGIKEVYESGELRRMVDKMERDQLRGKRCQENAVKEDYTACMARGD